MHFRFDQLGKNILREVWEQQVALPWLRRLSFELPDEALQRIPAEEGAWIMETRELFEQWKKQVEESGAERGVKRGRLESMARIYGKRLGRPLTDTEREVLAERLDRLGEDRVEDVVLTLSADAVAAWLADPNAQ